MPEHYEMKLQRGDVVRLAESVTMAEFGLALCDDDGAGLERLMEWLLRLRRTW